MGGWMNSTWEAMYLRLGHVLAQVLLLYRKASPLFLTTKRNTVQVVRGVIRKDKRRLVLVVLVLLLPLLLLAVERLPAYLHT
jgi:hypothetical protein